MIADDHANSETPGTPIAGPNRPKSAVPTTADRYEPPTGTYELAWHYLVAGARMRRRVETVDILDLQRARRTIDIDFSLPQVGERETTWMVPAAFLHKFPVAPDLEVRDASHAVISIPTKDECMALTASAIDQLNGAGEINLQAAPELRDLVWQVTSKDLADARAARQIAEILADPDDELLRSLLFTLEDQFLLWVPAHGPPGCDHHVEITRRQPLARNVVLTRRRETTTEEIDTPIGPVEVEIETTTGPLRFIPSVALARIRLAFGLAPLEYEHEVNEAHRFSSCHLRILAPQGLIVRDLGLEAPAPGTERDEEPDLRPVDIESSDLTLRGRQLEMAHLHCARNENPAFLTVVTTLGIRDRLTSLWSAAVILTALLLLAIVDRAPYPLGLENGSLEVTAAVLLVGPTLASAWAIRADHGEVLETMLVGARWMLLAAAALSVTAAFGLAGFPSTADEYGGAVEGYATAGFFIATVVATGSLVASRLTWLAYRTLLVTPRRTLSAVMALAIIGALAIVHDGMPAPLSGAVLALVGLALAAVAVYPGPAGSFDHRGISPVVAATAAIGTLFAAGYYLGYYGDLAPGGTMRLATLCFEGLLGLVALVIWYRAPGRRPVDPITI